MLLIKVLIIFSLTQCSMSETINDPTCLETLRSFALVSSNFTYCTIVHARPITVCQNCVQYYIDVLDVYDDITQIEASGGQLCKYELVNLDRLQVLNSGLSYVADLWTRASCDSCFKPNGNQPSTTLTPSVKQILNASSILQSCIELHKNESKGPDEGPCKYCVSDYLKFNQLYNDLKATSGEINFCMDIVDLVNKTRSEWSGTLQCCHDKKKSQTVFLISSAVVSMLSVIFYATAFTFTVKEEHQIVPQKRWHENFAKRRTSFKAPSQSNSVGEGSSRTVNS